MEIEKEIVREAALGGQTPPEKIFRSKSTNQEAFVPLTGLIWAFRSEDFLRWCLSPERNLTHNFFFLFPIVFGINGILREHMQHTYDLHRRTSSGCNCLCRRTLVGMAGLVYQRIRRVTRETEGIVGQSELRLLIRQKLKAQTADQRPFQF